MYHLTTKHSITDRWTDGQTGRQTTPYANSKCDRLKTKLPSAREIVHQQYCQRGHPSAYVPQCSRAQAQSSHHSLQSTFTTSFTDQFISHNYVNMLIIQPEQTH